MSLVFLLAWFSLFITQAATILWLAVKIDAAIGSLRPPKKAPIRRKRKVAPSAPLGTSGVVAPSLPLELEEDPGEPLLPLSTDRGGAFADAYDPAHAEQPLRKQRAALAAVAP